MQRDYLPPGYHGISIHALREEGDPGKCRREALHPRISIHALREEGDAAKIRGLLDTAKFLSTPSARRATRDPSEDTVSMK